MVWATRGRLSLITPDIQPRPYAAIAQKRRELKCVPPVIGGVADHIHLLVRLHTTVSVAGMAEEVKGSSSHLVTHEIALGESFKWQGVYGALTCGKVKCPWRSAISRIKNNTTRQVNCGRDWNGL